MRSLFFIGTGILVFLTSTAINVVYSQLPSTLSYQGMLSGTEDKVVDDGIYEMHFNLYNAVDLSTPLWAETQNVAVVNGIFNAILGSVNPLDLPFDEQYYLGIAVGEEPELSPRIALTSSAYSFRARSIDDGQVVKSINELRDDILFEAGENITISEDENKIIISATSSGATGTITQVTAGDGLTGGGTEGEVTLAVDNEGIKTEMIANGAVTGSKLHDMDASNGQVLQWNGSTWEPADARESLWSANEDIIFYTSGRVGIGTNEPGQALDVNGNIEVSGWIGTVEEAPVEFRVNNEAAVRIIPAFSGTVLWPNIIAGAPTNQIAENITLATISGGANNSVSTVAATIGGGFGNKGNGVAAYIGGGYEHTASGFASAIVGGEENRAEGRYSAIGGGWFSIASGEYATIGGGSANEAVGEHATISGGGGNMASGLNSVIGGGHANITGGSYSTVPGGLLNSAEGDYSFASGRRAKANHNGAFVWADQTDADFASTGDDQFLIRARGGVGIGTNTPRAELHIAGINNNADLFLHRSEAAYGFNFGVSATPKLFIARSDGSEYNDILVIDGSTDRVGIGTSTPDSRLDIRGFAGEDALRIRVDGNTRMRLYQNGGTALGGNPSTVPTNGLYVASNTGIGTTSPGSFLLAVNGDAAKPGGGSWSNFSDKRLKRDIQSIEPGILDHLLTLRGYTFEYLAHAIENRLALPGRQFGLIAQEVIEVIPEWVDTDDEGYLYITERGTTALFIEALRELRKEKNSEIESLHTKLEEKYNRIHDLERRIESLENIFNENFAGKEKYEF